MLSSWTPHERDAYLPTVAAAEQDDARYADAGRRFPVEYQVRRDHDAVVAGGELDGSMERRFGALGSFGFDAVGDLWSRPQLSRRDRSLLVLPVLSAQARDEELVPQRQTEDGSRGRSGNGGSATGVGPSRRGPGS
jgi:alkylhydroperoxidase/carboxymuconolactone decarboxylase family protein YurZ